jgi:hypothetical protein
LDDGRADAGEIREPGVDRQLLFRSPTPRVEPLRERLVNRWEQTTACGAFSKSTGSVRGMHAKKLCAVLGHWAEAFGAQLQLVSFCGQACVFPLR